ncbi:Spherulin-1A [Fusarium oxysporum f. sp. albedinis]|nr:Spherulin-1A [Fusarium oxysporum f. sp. albedinis]
MPSADASLVLRNTDVASPYYCYPLPDTTPQPTPSPLGQSISAMTPEVNGPMVTGADLKSITALWQTGAPSHAQINTPATLLSSNLSRTIWTPPEIATETLTETSSASAKVKTSGVMLWLTFLSAMALRSL